MASGEWPLTLFMGVRDDEYFQTGHRHIAAMRARKPEPLIFLSPSTAGQRLLADGDWVRVTTIQGNVKMRTSVRPDMPDGVVRVPHGWWTPERLEGDGSLSGAWDMADAQICPDDADYLDREQGIPHLKGIPCRVEKLPSSESTPAGQQEHRDQREAQ